MTFLIVIWALCQENRDVGVQGLCSFDEGQKWRSPPLADLLLCDSGSRDLNLRSSYDTVVNEGIVLHLKR